MPAGGANGGPQYSPTNVSATGGAGQSGTQAAKYYSGGTYGEGKQLMEQQQSAPLAGSPTPVRTEPLSNLPQAIPLTEPTTRPDEPVTTGVAMGPGAGPEALTMPMSQDGDEDKQRLLSYLPALEVAALSPNSSQAFRNYVRVLRANIR
jgi:hypothetical protein